MLATFKERAEEIDEYFDFVEALADGRIVATASGLAITPKANIDAEDTGPPEPVPISPIVVRTLKGASYLLLYNLVESSMRNAVQGILDEITEKRVSYVNLRPEIRRTLIKRFARAGGKAAEKALTSSSKFGHFTSDAIALAFAPGELFSGNVDAQRVRGVAAEYGFPSVPEASDAAAYGRHLLDVKQLRNDLAHGVKSFTEVGRSAEMENLAQAKDQTKALMDAVLTAVDVFISGKGYLDAVSGGVVEDAAGDDLGQPDGNGIADHPADDGEPDGGAGLDELIVGGEGL